MKNCKVFGSYGIPATACVVAYDSIQRLLLVGTRDGRIKLVGTAAVERTLVSERLTATVSLHVLPNTGCFLRLASCGTLELWSIRDCACLCTLSAEVADPIVTCCPLMYSPFALLGTGCGTMRCCALVNSAGEHVGPARPVHSLVWMPFQMTTADLHIPDDSELQHVTSMQRSDGEVRALLLHEFHTISAISLVSGQVIGQLGQPSAIISSDITTMCWANAAADQVLTGHDDGNIHLWGLVSGSFHQLDSYAVVPDEPRSSVTSLSMVLGPHMSIVASGGNHIDVPNSVSLIHVAPSSRSGSGPGAVQYASHVPWFGRLQGFALVRPRGSFRTHDVPTAVITLTEGGYMCIQDIDSGRTDPFVGDFQSRVIVTSALALVPQSLAHPSALCIDCLQEQHSSAPLSDTWAWALHSGRPCHSGAAVNDASTDVDVLLTGHDNGAVSLWDMRSLTPQRLSHVATSVRTVTTVQLDPVTGLLATGHAGGEVNVHLWSPDGPQTDGPHVLTSSAWPAVYHTPERKTRGSVCWEHVLHISGAKPPLGTSERVIALALHRQWQPLTVRLAVAFASAGVAVVDLSEGLSRPKWLFESSLGGEVPGSLAFAQIPARGAQQRARASRSGEAAELQLALVVATADSCLRVLDAADGRALGDHWMVPKTKEPLLACIPLAADGSCAQCSDDGGVAAWTPCANGWTQLHSGSRSHTPRTGLSDALTSREPSGFQPQLSGSTANLQGAGGSGSGTDAGMHAGAVIHGAPSRTSFTSTQNACMRNGSPDLSQTLDVAMGSRDASLDELAGTGEDAGHSDDSDGELEAAAAQEDARQRNPRTFSRAASGKAATKLKGIFNTASRASYRITDKAAAQAKTIADKAATQAKSVASRRMSFMRGDRNTGTSTADDDDATSQTLADPIAEGLSPRHRHSSSELSSPRRPNSKPSSPLSGVISVFSRHAPTDHHSHVTAWILVITRQCMRVYPASAAVTGSRSTAAKYKAGCELAAGAVIAPPGEQPVAVAWSEATGLHIAKLPALEVTDTHKLEDITGWRWNWAGDVVASKHQRERFAASSDTGLLCMIGPCCELLMMGIARQRAPPLLADRFHDEEIAAAAYSAQAAPSVRRRSSGDSGGGGSSRRSAAGSRAGAVAGEGKQGLQGLLAGLDKKLKDVLQDAGGRSAVEAPSSAEEWQGAQSDAGVQLERLFRCSGPSAVLAAVSPQPQSPQRRTGTPQVTPPRAAVSPRMSVSSGGAASGVAGATSAAPGSAAPAASVRRSPAVRSASEIRRAYGRDRPAAAQTAAQSTQDVMHDNVARLNERMERLAGIEDRANDLAKDAEDFASMAKKLNKEANRPWWNPF